MGEIELGGVHRTPSSTCPTCGLSLNASACCTGQHRPKPSDCTVCTGCGEFLVFNGDMSLRRMSFTEEMGLADRARSVMRRLRNGILAINRTKKN